MKNVTFAKNLDFEKIGDGVTRKILSYDENIMPVEVHFEEGSIGSVHTHPNTQVTYVLAGSFKFSIGDKSVIVNKGDTLLFPSNIEHGTICLEKGILLDVFTPYRKDFL